MANSQKEPNVVDLLSEIVDLDELLRFLCGAATDDACIRGLAISLLNAKQLSGAIRSKLEKLANE
ncbi:hypothetical protein ATY36_13600 [Vibrio cidicii]|uniref:hypothetical protein n=1 Tax=Vibrio cidicii TaxID=1763883 RepID=UPI00077FF6E9|nr:hypothetical protein [Vibrio cidicii]KYN82218.1 hypothetical protein ATY36_13600 [Vibrio cidicii]